APPHSLPCDRSIRQFDLAPARRTRESLRLLVELLTNGGVARAAGVGDVHRSQAQGIGAIAPAAGRTAIIRGKPTRQTVATRRFRQPRRKWPPRTGCRSRSACWGF